MRWPVEHASCFAGADHPLCEGRRTEDADVDLSEGKGGFFGGDDDVAHGGQRDAGTDSGRVDRTDDRDRAVADGEEGLAGQVVWVADVG
jgi:hypothetical protein